MKLLTKAIEKKIPALYSQDGLGMKAIVHAKFFAGAATWYITEYDGEDTFFGWADLGHGPGCAELGYISKSELENFSLPYFGGFGQKIERDRYFDPKPLEDCI
jgi:hypothetical protein